MSWSLSLRRNHDADVVMLSRDRLDQVQASLDVAHNLARVGSLSEAEQAVERARALVTGAIDDGHAEREASAAARLRLAYENGMAARSHGRRANPFEDAYGTDWPGRRSCAEAWSRGRDDWEVMREFGRVGFPGHPPESPVREVRLGESRDHRRRVLEHQERVEAAQREAAARPKDPQLRIPLIGEVRRPEPSQPKRRRPRTSKSVQPGLGES